MQEAHLDSRGGGEAVSKCCSHHTQSVVSVGCGWFAFIILFCLLVVQMAVLKKHHRAAHHGHYYECLVKFKGVAYNKVCV